MSMQNLTMKCWVGPVEKHGLQTRESGPMQAHSCICWILFYLTEKNCIQHAWEVGVQLLRRETKATDTLLRIQVPGVTPPS